MNDVVIPLDLGSIEDYKLFLRVKALPRYRFQGRNAIVPAEYAEMLGIDPEISEAVKYEPLSCLWDYQAAFSQLAVHKEKFCLFVRCGYGKTLMISEFMRHAHRCIGENRRALIISPLMVINQTIEKCNRFYGGFPIEQVYANELKRWITTPGPNIGITNYEAITKDIPQGLLGALALDESSSLKNAYSKHGVKIIDLGKGLRFKLAASGTPAPNDRIEYALHAVFMDAFPTVNSFLARFFVNRGQTSERWVMKPHALNGFYKSLSDWSVFMDSPATYGFHDNSGSLPPVKVIIHDVDMTDDQNSKIRAMTGKMFVAEPGGIVGRSKLARIAKSGDSLKPAFIHNLVKSWPERSTLIWCRFNDEQDRLAAEIPGSASIQGTTKTRKRQEIIEAYQKGHIKTVISKGKVLGYGLDLEITSRMIFSSLHDSYEEYAQCLARANRVGATEELEVHIPITEAERPMAETVLRKVDMTQRDTEVQEALFKNACIW